MIDKKYIDLILDTVDLQEVVSDYGIALKVKGHRAWGCCPFHNEKTASFCVDTAKNLWFCHGACHEGGNVITFVMKMIEYLDIKSSPNPYFAYTNTPPASTAET